jgi:hypothetical protein
LTLKEARTVPKQDQRSLEVRLPKGEAEVVAFRLKINCARWNWLISKTSSCRLETRSMLGMIQSIHSQVAVVLWATAILVLQLDLTRIKRR